VWSLFLYFCFISVIFFFAPFMSHIFSFTLKFKEIDNDGTLPEACAGTCPNTSTLVRINTVNGKCEMKECTARTPQAGAALPCGSGGCYQDVGGSETDVCVQEGSCSNASFYEGTSAEAASSGKCTLKNCVDRVPRQRLAIHNFE
jgi:hypothetical protein